MEIKVEKGIPLPPITRGVRKSKYPFDDLKAPEGKVLYSFFWPNVTSQQMQSAASRYMRSPNGKGKELTVRHTTEDVEGVPTEGVRVFRMK